MEYFEILTWLLQGDISTQYQVFRDLLNEEKPELQQKIEYEGWGKKYLSLRKQSGHWGAGFYYPKWTSSHYTILVLKELSISPFQPEIQDTIEIIAKKERGKDGGIHPSEFNSASDVCINGMFLNYASYFKTDEENLKLSVDFLLSQIMPDGGFNCMKNRKGAVHSSLHTTLSVLEGIYEYKKNGYLYRIDELIKAENSAREFILVHQLFLSDKTGKIIHYNFLNFPYPCRWKYDILKALDYFQHSETPFDERMTPALNILNEKQNKYGTWNLNAKYPGKQHFEMEKAGKPSRWNTLRALRVLKTYLKYVPNSTFNAPLIES